MPEVKASDVPTESVVSRCACGIVRKLFMKKELRKTASASIRADLLRRSEGLPESWSDADALLGMNG